jgi:nucleotide-binding universal stress UspA family protein
LEIKKILAGIDFGKDTEKALSYAAFFAKEFKASLNLLYVIDYLITPPAYMASYIEEEKNTAVQRLTGLMEQLKKDDIQTETEVMTGRLQESFEAAAKKMHADLLVLGFVSHTLRRSSSEKLIKGLQMPMLVVRGGKAESAATGSVKIRRILCPFDFSEPSATALTAAMELQDVFSSELDILHVIPDSIISKNIANKESCDSIIKSLNEENMTNLMKIKNDNNINATCLVEKGAPDKTIVSLSKERDIDLIVIGARGLGLIKGMFIGSVTDAVLKSSPCPVFIIQ